MATDMTVDCRTSTTALALLSALSGCGEDPGVAGGTSGGATDTADTTGIEESSTGSSAGSTATTSSAESTDGTSGGPGSTETTGSTSTGPEEVEASRARILYLGREATPGPNHLFYVDYDDGRTTTPAPVLTLDPDEDVDSIVRTSSDRRWMAFRTFLGEAHLQTLYVVDTFSAGFPQPVRINVAPVPDPARFLDIVFSPDSTQLAFVSGPFAAAGQVDLYLAPLDGDILPVQINPPVAPGGAAGYDAQFSPDGARIAYVADFDGGGQHDIYIQNASALDPGSPIRISTGGGVLHQWASDGSTISYLHDGDDDGILEFYVVDVTGEPLPPQIHDPADTGEMRGSSWAPDGRGAVYWTGEDGAQLGDLYFVPFIDGAFGSRVWLGSANGSGNVNYPRWSPASTHLTFPLAEGGLFSEWVVEVDNGIPSVPMRVNDKIAPTEYPNIARFDSTGSAIYHFTYNSVNTFFRIPLGDDGPGPPTVLNPADVLVEPAISFSEDGSRALFTGTLENNTRILYELDPHDAADSVTQLSPSEGQGSHTTFYGQFAPTGSTVFFRAYSKVVDGESFLYSASPGEPGLAHLVGSNVEVTGFHVFDLP